MTKAKEDPKRRIGGLEGKFKLPDDFEELDKQLDAEIEQLFYGGELFPPEEPRNGSSDEKQAKQKR
jgi:hypothetical protein